MARDVARENLWQMHSHRIKPNITHGNHSRKFDNQQGLAVGANSREQFFDVVQSYLSGGCGPALVARRGS